MPLPDKLLPTSLVGSYAQPDWLIDRDLLHIELMVAFNPVCTLLILARILTL